MDLGHPFKVITPTVDGDVLRVLARASAEFTPPEVHRRIGEHSVDGVRRSLERLHRQGIVLRREAGKASLYALNRSHLAAPAIVELADVRDEFLRRVRSVFEDWKVACPYAVLFGSAARGDMHADSDIDLFVVRPKNVDAGDSAWAQQLVALSGEVFSWTGNDARILEYGEGEIVKAASSQLPILLAIEGDGVHLTGPSNFLRKALSKTAA
jgi:hypothetical protein